MSTPVTQRLHEAGLKYEIREHEIEAFTVAEAAGQRGVEPNQIVKVMVVEANKNFHAFLIPGDQRLDLDKVRNYLNESDAKLASRKNLKEIGLTVGAISPLQLEDIPIYIDKSFDEMDEISFSAGVPDKGIIANRVSVFELLNGSTGHFV